MRRPLLMQSLSRIAPLSALLLSACAGFGPRQDATYDRIAAEMKQAAQRPAAARPEAVEQALLPPLQLQVPRPQVSEQRFDLILNNASASQVFNAIVTGTRYSMLVHPEVSGTLSLNLKDVTVKEALDAIRELYGYEYKIDGNRIYIQPVTLQSRVFQVSYLMARRQGRSDTRVESGSITGNGSSNGTQGGTTAPASGTSGTQNGTGGSGSGGGSEGTHVFTTNTSDFWFEVEHTIQAIVGPENGRRVVVSPQSGVIVVRAMPRELRDVENYLKTSKLALERQVMLEAKIVEVELNDGYQQGINWTALTRAGNHRLAIGADPRQIQTPGQQFVTPTDATSNTLGGVLATPFAGIASMVPLSDLSGALGLTFTTNSFQAILSFLDTQGSVQVLSNPRIATINNQKAVLKVGTDDFYVTNITTNTATSGTGTTSSPSITVQPFFSGISLDVTPQIDEEGHIILHVRPSVSVVTERTKNINLGTLGTYQLPLASSRTNQTDSVVRVQDGYIVAIGGLMEQEQSSDAAKVPGAGDVPLLGALFGQSRKVMHKRELVVLIKPTVIHGDRQWEQDIDQVGERLKAYEPTRTPAPAPAAQ
jgi:MSHA biogenesis protein MshL